MKMYTNLVLPYLLICSIISCGQDDRRLKNTGKDSLTDSQSENFKIWLGDTIKTLLKDSKVNNYVIEAKNNNYTITLQMSNDSSDLAIIKRYKVKVNPDLNSTYEDSCITFVLGLLSNSKEIPKSSFDLNFSVKYFYYPGMYEGTKEMVMELDFLKISLPSEEVMIEYTYNRGSFSTKKITREIPACPGCLKSVIEEHFDFIFDDVTRSFKIRLNNKIQIDQKKL